MRYSLMMAAALFLAVGCQSTRIHDNHRPTVRKLHEMVIPGIGVAEPLPLPEVVRYLQEACNASPQQNEISFTVDPSAQQYLVTNDWPTISGKRRTAYEYMEMIAASAPVRITITEDIVTIFGEKNK